MDFKYQLKNFKEIKIENSELILVWDKNSGCATEFRFALEDIESLGINLKPRKDNLNESDNSQH